MGVPRRIKVKKLFFIDFSPDWLTTDLNEGDREFKWKHLFYSDLYG